jgi:uncharacterized protein YjbI with pentapeptide repeats
MKHTVALAASVLFSLTSTTGYAQQYATDAYANVNVPQDSCRVAAGALGSTAINTIQAIDGATLKDAKDIKSLRSKARDGRPIVIRGGDFSNQKFGDDYFGNICFVGTKLVNTKWTKSRARGAGFIDSDLSGASFDRVILDYAIFRNTQMARMDASGAKLNYGLLDGGWDTSMEGLRLENAAMMGFRFVCGNDQNNSCAFNRKQITLRGSDLSSADVSSFSFWETNLIDVKLNQTMVHLDQMTQFDSADIVGPVIIRADKKRVALDKDAFRLAMGALTVTKTADTECNNPDSALSQLFCQAGRGSLRAYRDDIDRLYAASVNMQNLPTGGNINVTAPSKEQDRYLKALKNCVRKSEDLAIPCINTTMNKRREQLVMKLMKARPLEQDARALYVSVNTPLISAIVRDQRLAALGPLMIDSSPQLLLVYRDDDQRLVARAVGKNNEGLQCNYAFTTGRKSGRKALTGPTFAAWDSGGEFVLGETGVVKKKKKVKKPRKVKKGKKGQTVSMTTTVTTSETFETPTAGCAAIIRSGPLVRVTVTEDEFDRIWATKQT